MLKVTILGSGNFLPDTNRHCSSYLYEFNESKVMFDFGRGAIDGLIKKKIKRRPKGRICITELKDKEIINLKGLKVQAYEVEHAQGEDRFKALSYRIYYKSNIICYSGDVSKCKGIRDACRNADLAVIEATLPKKANVKSHMNGEDLGLIAKEENVKSLIATHVDKSYLPYVKSEIKKNYKGQASIARDLMSIKVK